MKNINSNSAFTLTELIVVIVILSILATIGFISLQGFMKDARNSARATDVKTIQKVLQLHYVENVSYPLPDNYTTVSYSGDVVHNQGTWGQDATIAVKKISTPPADPSTGELYVYSVSVARNEYEILAVYEDGLISQNTPIPGVANAYAADIDNPVPKVSGMYNQVFVQTQNHIVPLPSIINAEVSGTGATLDNDVIDSYVVTDGDNIPQIGDSITAVTRQLDVNLSVFDGKITKESSDAEKQLLAERIQSSLGSTVIKRKRQNFKAVLDAGTDNSKISSINQIFGFDDPYASTSSGGSSGGGGGADGAGGVCDFSGDDLYDGNCNFGS